MNDDLGELYMEIYEEGWKTNLAGLAAAGLGAATMWPSSKEDTTIQHSRTGEEYVIQINKKILNLMKNDEMLKALIQNYFKKQGKPTNITIDGDLVSINGKQIEKQELMLAIDTAYENGDTQRLSGYLANNL